jgi:hypothetical protein
LVGFPRASNTGTTGTLARYTGPLNITAAGTVLQNVDVDGCLTLGAEADDVTIKNVMVRSNRCYWLVLNGRGATGLHVTDTELDGQADQIRNVDIDNNQLGGGAFTVYGGYELGTDAAKVSGIRITDNEFTTTVYAKSGAFGPLTSTAQPAVTVSGNT